MRKDLLQTERAMINAVAYTSGLASDKKREVIKRYCGLMDLVRLEPQMLQLLDEHARHQTGIRGFK